MSYKKPIKARVDGVSVSWAPRGDGSVVVIVHGVTTKENIEPARDRFVELSMTRAEASNLAFLLRGDTRADKPATPSQPERNLT